jgi:hypothetical protein
MDEVPASPEDLAKAAQEVALEFERELVRLRRRCTPQQRRWLAQIPKSNYQEWAAANALKINPRTVYRWMRMPHIREYLAATRELHMQRIGVNELTVLSRISDIADGTGANSDRLRALELLGKFLKIFGDRHEVTGRNGEPLSFLPPVIQIVGYQDEKGDSGQG